MLSQKIRDEIAVHGAITFARFMELALYCPDTGFYEKDDDTVGRRGDFYTSICVGPMFGELLAFQIADWMVQSGAPFGSPRAEVGWGEAFDGANVPGDRFLILEAGAHRGALAKDILTWFRRWRTELFARLDYWIIEPSRRRQQWQSRNLEEFAPRVHWADSFAAAAGDGSPRTGIIIANELLDAMPVHRLGWDADRQVWFEWGVTWRDERFSWVRLLEGRAKSWTLPWIAPELLEVLPDGFTTELSPLAEKWWGEAAGFLRRGKLLTFDYGLESEEFFLPHRTQGTLRAYRKHQMSEDILAHPGEQDITAQVNLSRIRDVGEAAGWRTESQVTQAQFLTNIAARFWQAPERNGRWSAKQNREFQTLVHPQHLGRAFRVVLQAR